MHNFLCYDCIDALQPSFTGTTSGYNTNGIMRQIYIGFSKQYKVWYPFHNLKSLLSDPEQSRNMVTQDHHRLLFENYSALKPGAHVIVLLAGNHTYLKHKDHKPIMQMALQKNPLITRAINGKIFECVVWSNRYANDFADNTLTQQQIKHLCSF